MNSHTSVIRKTIAAALPLLFTSIAQGSDFVTVSVGSGGFTPPVLTAEQRAGATSGIVALRADQLPESVRARYNINDGGIASQAYGSGNHPNTTKRASTNSKANKTIKLMPYAATGILWADWGGNDLRSCTAAIVDKAMIVTAGHCVVEFGTGDAPDEMWFEPARHAAKTPYKSFVADTSTFATSYANGSDVCAPSAPGVICENNFAVVTLKKNAKDLHAEEAVGGQYVFGPDSFGFTSFLGESAVQLTQLGYPTSMDDGLKMIRTDSLGLADDYNQVVFGSDQTGGDGGSPLIANFGKDPARAGSNPAPTDNADNTIIGVTTWGYSSEDAGLDVQGGTRFGYNTQFTSGLTNIEFAKMVACSTKPSKCY